MQNKQKVIVIEAEVDYEDGTWHTCPYAEDIYGDCESLCNCDADQEYECAMDI
jgi:hypothetical protein